MALKLQIIIGLLAALEIGGVAGAYFQSLFPVRHGRLVRDDSDDGIGRGRPIPTELSTDETDRSTDAAD